MPEDEVIGGRSVESDGSVTTWVCIGDTVWAKPLVWPPDEPVNLPNLYL